MNLICYHPYYSFVHFLALPSLLTFLIDLVAFYTCSYQFFNSIATECEGHGRRHGQVSSCVGYTTKAFVVHSLLHKCELQSTTMLSLSVISALIDSECEVPELLAYKA